VCSSDLKTFNFETKCETYYSPVRVFWKNKYGQFDWMTFFKRSNQAFKTEQRTYNPQMGSWSESSLVYNPNGMIGSPIANIQRYIVDSEETIQVNSDWLPEGYNPLLKQLLLSDEIWMLSDVTEGDLKNKCIPLSIISNAIDFKTGRNNKLIQYTLDFGVAVPHKFIV
jgi:hypothetical protein